MEIALNPQKTSSSSEPNYFSILSARDTIQTLNRSQDIQLLPIVSAFLNIQPNFKYHSLRNMNIF